MNILITGVAGFIGKHLVPALLESDENTVYGLDLASANEHNEKRRVFNIDLNGQNWTSKLPPAVDVVVHLAQSLRYREFPAGAQDMFAVNVESTMRLLEWARSHGVRRFLFASTGNVYREHDRKVDEDYPCKPRSFYAASKRCAELMVEEYASCFQTVVMRIFGVYGPGQVNMIIPAMIDRVLSGKPISLACGKGLWLTPLFISDCVSYMKTLIHCPQADASDIFNLAGSEILSLDSVVEQIGVLSGVRPNIQVVDKPADYLTGDNRKLREATSTDPVVGIEEGIARTYEANSVSNHREQ